MALVEVKHPQPYRGTHLDLPPIIPSGGTPHDRLFLPIAFLFLVMLFVWQLQDNPTFSRTYICRGQSYHLCGFQMPDVYDDGMPHSQGRKRKLESTNLTMKPLNSEHCIPKQFSHPLHQSIQRLDNLINVKR